MHALLEQVSHPLAERLLDVMLRPTGTTTAGYPFLERHAWERFRDNVPHILGMGLKVLRASRALSDTATIRAVR